MPCKLIGGFTSDPEVPYLHGNRIRQAEARFSCTSDLDGPTEELTKQIFRVIRILNVTYNLHRQSGVFKPDENLENEPYYLSGVLKSAVQK